MSDPAPNNSLPDGSVLEEYKLERVLGVGAFGITYKGWDNHLKAPVAIKEFFPADLVLREGVQVKPKPGEDAEYYQFGLDAFIEEVRVLAQFKHPNIIRVSRYFTANGTAYFVMDYEDGTSLSDVLNKEKGMLSEDRLRSIFIPILEGLASVHSKKYLHRDIKPSNIYLRHDGTPILLDFGAARLEFGSTSESGECVLTPGYAPIEQYSPDGLQGPWSDLYAVGATLYRCITGHTPVNAYERFNALQHGMPDPLHSATLVAKGNYNPLFLKAIDWALSIKHEMRPQSVRQFLERLNVAPKGESTATPTFAYQPRQAVRNHKIVFAGPVGAGKTTAVSVLSDTAVIRTDQLATDMTRLKKAATTVAMDYGIMKLSDKERVHLYGTPGQERFDFMWEILQKGALGLVILIDNSSKSPLDDLEFYLKGFGELILKTKVVIGVNFMKSGATTIEDYYRVLLDEKRPHRINPPVLEVDARSKRDMAMLVQALLYSIDPGVRDYNV